MTEINSKRMLLKKFKCPSCQKIFKNLVQFNAIFSKCPICHYEECSEIIHNELNQENKNEINNSFDSNSNNRNIRTNLYMNNTNFSEIQNDDINTIIFRARIGLNNDDENSENTDIIDAITDNIISNILGSPGSYVIINREPFQHEENPPVEQNIIDKLNHFKMEKKNSFKNGKEEKLEFPKCTICLMEISEGMDCISMPCQHFFHDNCVTHWLKIHNTCPLCRFELSNNNFESQGQMNPQIEENIHQVINNMNNSSGGKSFEDVK